VRLKGQVEKLGFRSCFINSVDFKQCSGVGGEDSNGVGCEKMQAN
jgi:hypothetical protein